MSRLEDDLKTSHGKSRKTVTILVLLFLCASAGVIGGAVFWTLSDLPSINAIEEYVPLES
jgi:flagellar basal body-associated protein FliL